MWRRSSRLVVADASAIVEYLLGRPAGAERIITDPGVSLHVPSLCDVEVVAALRRGLLRGELGDARAAEALGDYHDLPLTRHPHAPLAEATLRLWRHFTAYDGAYTALALLLGASLLTRDERLARAVREHTRIRVE